MGDFLGMGGKDASSNSQANTTTSTSNTDRRQVVAEGAFGFASDNASININNQTIDAGIVEKALDTVAGSDAINGQGFNQLLTLADKLFTGAGAMIGKTQESALAQVEALNTVANDSKGKIDQKTVIVLAGAAALAVMGMNKK